MVRIAKKQFADWIAALRQIKSRVKFNFVIADFTVFCHTLQHYLTTDEVSANMRRRQLDHRTLVFDNHPARLFDVIDTTHLPGSYGVEVLYLTQPLLRDGPASSLYSMTLAQLGVNGINFDSMYNDCASTISILLGLASVEYWTNDTSILSYENCFFSKVTKQRVRHRILWKLNKHLSGAFAGDSSKLWSDPEPLAHCLLKLLTSVWSSEDHHLGYDFAGFAQFIQVVCRTVQTDVRRLRSHLVLNLPSHPQHLQSHLRRQLLFEVDIVFGFSLPKLQALGPSWHYTQYVDRTLSIALVLRRSVWHLFRRHYRTQHGICGNYDVCLPSNLFTVFHRDEDGQRVRLVRSDVHIIIAKVTDSSMGSETAGVKFEEDARGFPSYSPMVVTFVAKATPGMLQKRGAIGISEGERNLVELPMGDAGNKPSSVMVRDYYAESGHLPVYGGGPTAIPTTDWASSDAITQCGLGLLVEGFNAPEEKPTEFTAGHIVGFRRLLRLSDQERVFFHNRTFLTIDWISAFKAHLEAGNSAVYPLHFPLPGCKIFNPKQFWSSPSPSVWQIDGYLSKPGELPGLRHDIFTVRERARGGGALPVTLSMAHVSMHSLPQISLGVRGADNSTTENMLKRYTEDGMSSRKRELGQKLFQNATRASQEQPGRLDFRTVIEALFKRRPLEAPVAHCFSLYSSVRRGEHHILIITLGLFVDGGNGSVVLAAAVIPWTAPMKEDYAVDEFFKANTAIPISCFPLDDAQLKLWKHMLPGMAERCREWSHGPDCEYTRPGATVPVSLELGAPCLCHCGQGKLGSYTDGVRMPAK